MAARNLMLCVFMYLVLGLITLAAANGPNGECPCNNGQCCSKAGFCGTSDAYCGKNNCASQCPSSKSCFPGDAAVELPGGVYRQMRDIAVGDKVAVTMEGRKTVFEPVYAFGHKDASVYADFVSLALESMDGLKHKKLLELTSGHFVPVVSGPARSNKRSMDMKVGEIVLARSTNTSIELSEFIVTGIAKVWKEGLYNPYTMGGSILVNGVLASAHSEWFLDAAFDTLGLAGCLPATYQAVLYPVRVLYGLLGHQAYATLYSKVDSLVNVAEFGTKHGGTIAGAAVATTGLVGYYYAFTNKKLKSY